MVRALFLFPFRPHLSLGFPEPAMREFLARIMLTAVLALGGTAALAHSALTGSDPAEGGTVSAGGFPVELRFNGRVDAARSRFVLTLADGSARKLAAQPGNGPSAIVAQAGAVPPGRCTLRYDVLSQDGHVTSGTLGFTATER